MGIKGRFIVCICLVFLGTIFLGRPRVAQMQTSPTNHPALDWDYTRTPSVTTAGFGDVNGDGMADLLMQYDTPDGIRHWVAELSNGTQFVDSSYDWEYTRSTGVTVAGFADVNGDGMADLLLQYDTPDGVRHWVVELSNGTRFVDTSYDWEYTRTPNVTVAGFADVDGNGMADLLLQYDTSDGIRHWVVEVSNGIRFVDSSNDWEYTRTANVTVAGFADVNGDGRADLLLQYDTSDGARHWVAERSNGARFVDGNEWESAVMSAQFSNVLVAGLADANADGMADLIVQYDAQDTGTRRWQVHLSTGSSFQPLTLAFSSVPPLGSFGSVVGSANPFAGYLVTVAEAADVDGDGQSDLLLQSDTADGIRHWQVHLSTGSAFDATGSEWDYTTRNNTKVVGLADVNGDGKADLILQYDTQDGVRHWVAELSNGAQFVDSASDWDSTRMLNVRVAGLADVNGDGKADLLLQYDTQDGVRHWVVELSNGAEFVDSANDWDSTRTLNVRVAGLADVNGDGKADLLLQYDTPDGVRHWAAELSNGSGFIDGNDWYTTQSVNVRVVGLTDVNGDHLADMIFERDTNDGVRHWETVLSNGSAFISSCCDLDTAEQLSTSLAEDRIALYIYVPGFGWVTKPTTASPYTSIDGNGNWACSITTGGNDASATTIAAFLFNPADSTPPVIDQQGTYALPSDLFVRSRAYVITCRGTCQGL